MRSGETEADPAAARSGVLLALAAVFAFSTSPVLVLWAAPLTAYQVTFVRLAVATTIVVVLGRLSRQPLLPARSDWGRFVLFGLVTSVHFFSYIASLTFTTIAHSLAIVYTAPIFVTLFSSWFLKEPVPWRKWIGIIVAVAGIGVLAGFEPRLDRRMLIGDGLALVSAITFGLYSVAGRSQRDRYGLFTYAGTVYGLAALWAAPLAALNLNLSGVTFRSVLAAFGAGLIPLGTGHTLYNAALRRTHATVVNLIATQEVTGGVLLGLLLVGQIPQVNEIVGIVITLLGIAMVLI